MPSTRIRSFKPEFWTLPSTERLSQPARFVRAAMMHCANDHGYGETNLYLLLGVAFPESDGVTLDELKGYLREVADHCDVIFYTVAGRHYFCITDWQDHQQIKKRGKQWCPPLDGPDVEIDQRFHPPMADSPGTSGDSLETPGIPPIRTVEQGSSGTGNRGTAEQWNRGSAEQRNSGAVDQRISGMPARHLGGGVPRGGGLNENRQAQLAALTETYPDQFQDEP
jgi:hypothetical protein